MHVEGIFDMQCRRISDVIKLIKVLIIVVFTIKRFCTFETSIVSDVGSN